MYEGLGSFPGTAKGRALKSERDASDVSSLVPAHCIPQQVERGPFGSSVVELSWDDVPSSLGI